MRPARIFIGFLILKRATECREFSVNRLDATSMSERNMTQFLYCVCHGYSENRGAKILIHTLKSRYMTVRPYLLHEALASDMVR